jgi:molybdopterin biosynthesis enzyme
MAGDNDTQRIARLTPLVDVLARIEALVRPVEPRPVQRHAAVGRVLADNVVAPAGLPAAARALRDGFAVCAEVTSDASSYAPAPLMPPPLRVDVGDILPPGTDAVAPLDVVVARDGRHEVLGSVAPGEGVLAIDADIRAGTTLRRAGERLRAVDEAVMAADGIERVMVREPRVRLVQARAGRDTVLEAASAFIAQAITAAGGSVQSGELAAALGDASADAVIAIGGTGSGRNDTSVRTLARLGRVEMHGIALSPGETAAFGMVQARPVLLIPGRIDAALAVWLAIGRPLLARLSASSDEMPGATARLTRKVASPLGLTEVVPVRVRDGAAEPIASGYWPLAAIAEAEGWILVPPDSEGFPAGAEVVVKPWP